MQRNWIGRSRAPHVDFADRAAATRPSRCSPPGRTRCTARRSSSSPRTRRSPRELCAPEKRAELDAYVEQVRKLSDIDRQTTERPKTGVDLGVVAVNPVNGEELPVFAADYVLADYGTGAIMAVPAHDQRDLDFAQAFDLPVRVVVDTGDARPERHRDRHRRRRFAGQLRPVRRAAEGRGDRGGRQRTWRPRAWAARRSTTGCATGCSRASATGAARFPSSTARRAAAFRCPTTSCR